MTIHGKFHDHFAVKEKLLSTNAGISPKQMAEPVADVHTTYDPDCCTDVGYLHLPESCFRLQASLE